MSVNQGSGVKYSRIKIAQNVVWYIVVGIGAIIFALPFIWMVSTALKEPKAVYAWPIQWIPRPVLWRNFIDGWTAAPFGMYFRNSCIIAFSTTLGTLLSASLAAYGFARHEFIGRDILFAAMLATMMVPHQVTAIPMYVIFRKLGWLDTFKPLIVPSFLGGGAFYIFLLRQFFMTIPKELEDAATIDGCNPLRIYWTIFMPLSKPALATAAIFSFMSHWNEFFAPLIYINSQKNYTLQMGLRYFQGEFSADYNMLMAVSLVSLLPCLILYFSAQKYFVQGVVMSGLKN
jgi:multiple sugar transport system permease protein